jgi:hypothetical protein
VIKTRQQERSIKERSKYCCNRKQYAGVKTVGKTTYRACERPNNKANLDGRGECGGGIR